MSILIKGMKMPKNCMECAIRSWTEDEWDVCPFSGIMALNIGRQNDCPLVEVPAPHGRLIDADATVKAWSGCTFRGNLNPLIESRPTVIEAEGEEHDER